MAEECQQTVHNDRSINPLLFPDLGASQAGQDEVSDRYYVEQSTDTARVPDLFSGLTEHVAGAEEGADADARVREASTETVLKFSHY